MSRRKHEQEDEGGPSGAPARAKRGRNRIEADHSEAAEDQAQNRRDQQAEIARRRAAHFANYRNEDEEDEEGGANPHVGGSTARTLGPWSSAVELANAREAALNARQEKLQEAAEAAAGKPQVEWTPRRELSLGPRPQCSIPDLFDLALALVVEYAEDVESLWGLPEVVRTRVAAAVCRARALSPAVARLFVQHEPQEVVLPDCASLDPGSMQELLLEAATPRLERLELGMCGRGLTDGTARALAAGAGRLPALQSLRLAGAYRLTDEGLGALLPAAPVLAALALPQCPLLEGRVVGQLPQLTPQLRELDLTECGVSLGVLLTALQGLPALEALVLDGVVEVTDDLLAQLPQGAASLQRLSLNHCAVSDAGLAAAALRLPSLLDLRLDDCTKVSPVGLSALTAHCRRLHTLSLRRCVRVTDAAVAELAALGTLRSLCLNSVRQLQGSCLEALATYCSSQLEYLDVSWCRDIPEQQLGRLVDACPNLATLELWGCTQVSETFLHGHASDVLRVVGRGEALKPVPVA